MKVSSKMLPVEFMNTYFSWFVLYICILPIATGSTFWCDKNGDVAVKNETSGQIRTRYEGESYYGANMKCQWLLDAGEGVSRRIQIRITRLNVQWAPEGAICNGYDYVEIHDGSDAKNSPSLVSFCGNRNPRSVMSTGRYLYVVFRSNDRIDRSYTGVDMDFDVFETSESVGSCPPNWQDDLNRPESNACYSIKSHKETFATAQQFCHYDQANLASLTDEAEADFVTNLLKDKLGETEQAWIGLNDIEEEGQYEWLDKSDSSAKYRWYKEPHEPNPFWNCVAIRGKDWLWEEQFCTESEIQTLVKHKFVCKMLRFGKTPLYNVPNERPEQKDPNPNAFIWIIVGCLGGIVLVAIIGVILYKHVNRPSDGGTHVVMTPINQPVSRPAAPYHDGDAAPPTYDEAISVDK